MTPPPMAGWNLAFRFCLELAALAGLGFAGWTMTFGSARWVAATALPVAAAIIWGVFNVLGDPSRSGAAPVEVNGVVRLAIELLVFGGGAAAMALAGRREAGIGFALLVAVHYAASNSRIEWLLRTAPDVSLRS